MDYYRARVSLGEYVILDNGAYELGRSVPFEYVLDVAGYIEPKEIVLPDVFLDGFATLEATDSAHEIIRHITKWDYTNLMVVPQGKNTDEWTSCLKSLVSTVKPDAIGIPIVYERMMGRGTLIHKTIEFLYNRTDCHPDIHLLGWDGDLYKLNAYARQFPLWLRGIDSAKPFYFAQRPEPKSILSGEDIKRPEGYFDLPSEAFADQVVDYNIKCMDLSAKGDLAQLFVR